MAAVFRARARLAPECSLDPRAAGDRLATLERRWSQAGFEALVAIRRESAGVVVHYRLSVPSPGDAPAAHAAFRDDLGEALRALRRGKDPPPASWDLEDLARATGVRTPGIADLSYEPDPGFRWER